MSMFVVTPYNESCSIQTWMSILPKWETTEAYIQQSDFEGLSVISQIFRCDVTRRIRGLKPHLSSPCLLTLVPRVDRQAELISNKDTSSYAFRNELGY